MFQWMKERNKTKVVVVMVFLLLLAYGLFVCADYNISPDEEIERLTGLINYKTMFQLEDEIGTIRFGELTELAEWRDRYYGVVAQYIPLCIEHLFGFELDAYYIYLIRHVFTFLLFWLACLCFYRLCILLGSEWDEALLGVLMLTLSPRILSDSFYNIKDSVFLSLMVMNLYAAILYMRTPNVWRSIVLAAVSAVCINVRVIGAEVLALCLLIMGVKGLKEKKIKAYLPYMIGTALLSLVCYVGITPITWSGLLEAVIGILSTFSNYSPWTGLVFFCGQALHAWELPWYYIPFWILSTTPMLCVVLCFVGSVCYVAGMRKREFDGGQWLVVLSVLIPVVYVILRKPALYNGWRHFYFIYPGIVLSAVYGWRWLKRYVINIKWMRSVIVAVMGVGLLSTAVWILRNHPYQCVYFNPLFREYANENMEKDYWLMAQQEALTWIAHNDPREKIGVCGGSIDYLSDVSMRDRFEKRAWSDAEYIIYSPISSEEAERFDGNYLWEKKGEVLPYFDGFELYDEVYQICAGDMVVCRVYRRTHNKNQGASLRYDEGQLQYDLNGVHWNMSTEEERVYFTGKIERVLAPDRIGVQSSVHFLPENIEVSKDGREWVSYNAETWKERDGVRLQINLDSLETQYIRLCFDKADLSVDEIVKDGLDLRLGFYYRTADPVFWRDSLWDIVTVNASENSSAQGFAVDGNMATRWDSGVSQREGITYTMELTKEYVLGGLTLDHGVYTDDYPRGLQVYGSVDGACWEEIPIVSKGFGYYECDQSKVRYIQMKLTEDSSWNWSICEIKLWIVP